MENNIAEPINLTMDVTNRARISQALGIFDVKPSHIVALLYPETTAWTYMKVKGFHTSMSSGSDSNPCVKQLYMEAIKGMHASR